MNNKNFDINVNSRQIKLIISKSKSKVREQIENSNKENGQKYVFYPKSKRDSMDLNVID